MHASTSCLLLVAALSSAPFQCSSEAPTNETTEETPGQALYSLAQRFRAQGDQQAWRATLSYLIERYPSSRFAATARDDLGAQR